MKTLEPADLFRPVPFLEDGPWGTKRPKKIPDGEGPKRPLGGGRSRQAFVSAVGGAWRVRYLVDGYSFNMDLPNLRLAGFVARLVHAAASPDKFLADGGVNGICDLPSPETMFSDYGVSAFTIFRADRDSDHPTHFLVDAKAADRIRGHPWFECSRKGVPKSLAVRPVVNVNRRTRNIKVSWISLEDDLPMGVPKPGKRPKAWFPPDLAVADLRTRSKLVLFRKGPGMERVKWQGAKRIAPTDGVFAPCDEKSEGVSLPREGVVCIQGTRPECLVYIVDGKVTRGLRPRFRKYFGVFDSRDRRENLWSPED